MTHLLADAIDQAQTIRTVVVWFVVVVGCLVAVLQLVDALYLKPKQRRSIGAIRFQLKLPSSAAARELPMWKPLLWAVSFSLIGGFPLLLGPLGDAKELGWRDCFLPLFFVGMGCTGAAQFGRRERLRWLIMIGGLCYSLIGAIVLVVIVSGERLLGEWLGREGISDQVLQYGFAIALTVCGSLILFGTVFGRTKVREGGIELGSQVVPWADVIRFEWFSYGDNYDLVVTVPSGGTALSQLLLLSGDSARKDRGNRAAKWSIPVPAAKKEEVNALLTDHVRT